MILPGLRNSILLFSGVYFIGIFFASYLYCGCFPRWLILVLYIFFILYLLLSFFGRQIFVRLELNPFLFLMISFSAKLVLVVGFAMFLITSFHLEQKLIIFLYVVGYIIAGIFDFIILESTRKNLK